MSTRSKVLVLLVAATLALLGLRWMFTPAAMAATFGIALTSPEALNTARGDLGGMFLAGASLCLIGIRSRDGRWLQAVAFLIAFVSVGRLIGLASDGFAVTSAGSIGVEVAMIAILLHAASQF